MSGCSVKIESEEASWSTGKDFEGGNMAHRAPVKGGYFPVPPMDSLQDIRNAISLALEEQGVEVEVFHHEVASAGQCEIGTRFNSLVKRADWSQILKYTVHMVAHSYGKTATFMPKPIVGDNGSGMHVHQSVWKGGQNLFAGDGYAGLSDFALYYIGGVIKHAKALNAITNPGTNSYKRLVPGFEAPINLAYSARNRSAACRIPYVSSPKGRRVEVRFPDPTANPYLCFAALLMAGLDGVQNKIHPGDPIDKNLYDLPPEVAAKVPHPCASLDEALESLEKDHEFLTRGGVFSEDMIAAYIDLKMEEVTRFPHDDASGRIRHVLQHVVTPVEQSGPAAVRPALPRPGRGVRRQRFDTLAGSWSKPEAFARSSSASVPFHGARRSCLPSSPSPRYASTSTPKATCITPTSHLKRAGGSFPAVWASRPDPIRRAKARRRPQDFPRSTRIHSAVATVLRRKVLTDELETEEKLLAEARTAYGDGAPPPLPDEQKDAQKYANRLIEIEAIGQPSREEHRSPAQGVGGAQVASGR